MLTNVESVQIENEAYLKENIRIVYYNETKFVGYLENTKNGLSLKFAFNFPIHIQLKILQLVQNQLCDTGEIV